MSKEGLYPQWREDNYQLHIFKQVSLDFAVEQLHTRCEAGNDVKKNSTFFTKNKPRVLSYFKQEGFFSIS